MSMSFVQQLEMSYSLFLLYVQLEVYQNILKLRCLTLRFFWTKRDLIFRMISWEKLNLKLYSTKWRNFIVLLPLILEILGKMSMIIICFPICDIINFEINHSFHIKPFSYMSRKSGQNLIILRTKKAFNMK